jgi:hypothetical protein
MNDPHEPSAAEEIVGHPGVGIGFGMIGIAGAAAGVAAGPLAGLLPNLVGAFALGRFQARFDKWREAVNADLGALHKQVMSMTDEQAKLIGECVSAALRGESAGRLDILRRAINGTLSLPEMREQEAVELGRILRDITSEEAAFVVKNRPAHNILIEPGNDIQTGGAMSPSTADPSGISVHPDTPEGEAAKGLISLGVLVVSGGGMVA